MKILILTTTLLAVLSLAGCGDHGHEHSNGHEHATLMPAEELDDHGHGGGETAIAITHFTEVTELFVEFPVFVVGRESPFAAHLTHLDNFKPVASGTVTVTLSGGGVEDEIFSVDKPSIPGIFRPIATPKHPVQRNVSLRLQGESIDVIHNLGQYTIHSSQAEALANVISEEEPGDAISYLKEQQWKVDFALTEAKLGELRASIQATGILRPRADGEVYLSATSAGHLQGKGRFPFAGMKVERGQLLATITPRLGTGGDIATLKTAMDKARSEYQLAKQSRSRLEKLWKEKAIAKHRLQEAKSTEAVAKAELISAERRYKQSTGENQLEAGIPILAPISGLLAQVDAAPGKYVHEGDELFHIVNLDRLWLEARISESDIGRLHQPNGAWFTLEGFEGSFNTFDLGGRLAAAGGVIDPDSRTAPLTFEFDNPSQRLRAGMFANVRVFTGEANKGVVVPASAIFDDGGQNVIYTMLGGESFQRRVVQLGIREGDNVIVISGVKSGERVVSRGAYQVRLASASPAEAGHGHAH